MIISGLKVAFKWFWISEWKWNGMEEINRGILMFLTKHSATDKY